MTLTQYEEGYINFLYRLVDGNVKDAQRLLEQRGIHLGCGEIKKYWKNKGHEIKDRLGRNSDLEKKL